jgi:MFS family permease
VADCASEENKGFYFSYFWAFYMGSQVIGNLIAAFALGESSNASYFGIMIAIAIVGTFMFLFIKRPVIQLEKRIETLGQVLENEIRG